ncbi:MAG: type II secretion system major pseudopilin GspG [Thermodesulfobacteriota bacterium]
MRTGIRSHTSRQDKGRYAAEQGFSLIELLVVLIILGFIASLAGPRLFGKLVGDRQEIARSHIEMLTAALDAYQKDTGRYPGEEEGLGALMQNPGVKKWDGPYLKKEVPLDPWGYPYHYRNPGQHGRVDIFSYGGDNKAGGEKGDADVGNW